MSREFDQRVRDLHEAPLTLDRVKGKAGRIRRTRRLVAAGGALAAAAVIVPIMVFAGGNLTDDSGPEPAPKPTPDPTVIDPSGTGFGYLEGSTITCRRHDDRPARAVPGRSSARRDRLRGPERRRHRPAVPRRLGWRCLPDRDASRSSPGRSSTTTTPMVAYVDTRRRPRHSLGGCPDDHCDRTRRRLTAQRGDRWAGLRHRRLPGVRRRRRPSASPGSSTRPAPRPSPYPRRSVSRTPTTPVWRRSSTSRSARAPAEASTTARPGPTCGRAATTTSSTSPRLAARQRDPPLPRRLRPRAGRPSWTRGPAVRSPGSTRPTAWSSLPSGRTPEHLLATVYEFGPRTWSVYRIGVDGSAERVLGPEEGSDYRLE